MMMQNTFFTWEELTLKSSMYSNVPIALVTDFNRFKINESADSVFIDGIETHEHLSMNSWMRTKVVN